MPARRSLTLYRRHEGPCEVHKLKLTAAKMRAYKKCNCTIYMFGWAGTFFVPRQSTNTRVWVEAEAQAQTVIDKNKNTAVYGLSIQEATQKFLASRKHELDPHTLNGYSVLFRNLKTYCAKHGVQFMPELKVNLLEDFKLDGLGDIKDTTKQTAVGRLKCFLRMAHRREWIKSPLAIQVTSHHADIEQKDPFRDTEVDAILREAVRPNKSKSRVNNYGSKPETFYLLCRLMLETGMRVSDAIRYDPSELERGESGLWVYRYIQTKLRRAKQYVDCFIADDLKQAIDRCDWFSDSRPFWRDGSTGASLGMQVWLQMQDIGTRAGVADCRPHRLRDTFAVRSLLRRLPLEDVSRLLGHSSVRTTERYYAKWVKARTRQLEARVAQSMQPQLVKTHDAGPSVAQSSSLSEVA